MEGEIEMNIKYFTCANSSNGFVNLTDSNISEIKNKFCVSCSSLIATSNFIRRIGEYFEDKGIFVEYILSPLDRNRYFGCVVKNYDFCLLDKRCVKEEMQEIDIGTSESLKDLENKIEECYKRMYYSFTEAKKIHDDWEEIYVNKMDFDRLNAFKKKTIERIFKEKRGNKKSNVVERFFGASTKHGYVNLVEELTEEIGKRYFIKGRPGTGKSTFMKEVAKEAEKRGFDAEIYKCSFDPNSLDMVIVREADFCVFDSTTPHEMFPSREKDYILDFYIESGLEGVDEKYKKTLDEISKEYKLRINEGMEHLKLASLLEKELEDKAGKFVDYIGTENMLKTLIAEVTK